VRPRIATRFGIAPLLTQAKMISPVQNPIVKTERIQLDDGKRGSLEFVSRMRRLSKLFRTSCRAVSPTDRASFRPDSAEASVQTQSHDSTSRICRMG
jgi:hypothetical protein